MTSPSLIPAPSRLTVQPGSLAIPPVVSIFSSVEPENTEVWLHLERSLSAWTGSRVCSAAHDDAWLAVQHSTALPSSAFELQVAQEGVVVSAADLNGVRHAWQALRQLIGTTAFTPGPASRRRTNGERASADRAGLPLVDISDAPRFEHRGLHVDVARHVIPLHELYRIVDHMAAHRLNAMQLHLSDDQGWRFEVRAYPLLAKISSWRTDTPVAFDTPHLTNALMTGHPHGGYYTQDQLRALVDYAAIRGVTIIPEIDLPGHSVAAIAAYPFLGVDAPREEVLTRWGVSESILDPSEATLDFYRTVLDELVEVFDSPTIHLGGDEVPYTAWEQSPQVQQRARDLGLSGVDELHGWFLGQLGEHLAAHGRRMGVWHEAIGPALPTNAVVNAWLEQDSVDLSLGAGHPTIVSRHAYTYFDYRESDLPGEPSPFWHVLPLDKVHSYDPAPEGEPILGVQAQLWTEYLPDVRLREYHLFPRLCAFAEVAWSQDKPDFEDFRNRLNGPEGHLARLEALGVEYRRESGPEPWRDRPDIRAFRERAASESGAPESAAPESRTQEE